MKGHSKAYCRSNGTWLYETPPTCAPILCPPLENVTNGNWVSIELRSEADLVNFNASLVVGFQMNLICDEGYISTSPYTVTCMHSGNWNYTQVLSCSPIKCHNIAIANGNVDASSSGYLQFVLVTCDYGYVLAGSSNLTCGGDGVWTPDIPVCEPITCAPLPQLTNGAVKRERHTASYSCNEGFVLRGDNSSSCNSNGDWIFTAAPPSCIPAVCKHPGVIPFGQVYGRDTRVCNTKLFLLNVLVFLTFPYIIGYW